MTDTQPQERPQTALDLWTEQVQGLTDPAHAATAINTIYERLMKLHGNFIKNDMPKQAGQAEEAYNLALSIFNDLQAHQTLVAGGAAAIQEAQTQRMEAVSELRMLLTSIEKGDEAHPKLSEYATAIREDEREDTLNDPYVMEQVYDQATEQADEALYDMIMETWDTPYISGDHMIGLLIGNIDPTDEQRDLIVKLFATLQPDITKRDPLFPVIEDLGGYSGEDDDEVDE